jgi:hypothetical protein
LFTLVVAAVAAVVAAVTAAVVAVVVPAQNALVITARSNGMRCDRSRSVPLFMPMLTTLCLDCTSLCRSFTLHSARSCVLTSAPLPFLLAFVWLFCCLLVSFLLAFSLTNLADNLVDDISWITGCPALERLYVAKNQITKVTVGTDVLSCTRCWRVASSRDPCDLVRVFQVPHSLVRTDRLRVLDLGFNAIDDISGVVACPALIALRLEHNRIASLVQLKR